MSVRFQKRSAAVAVEIVGDDAAPTADERAAWATMARANPRLYDGPTLMFEAWDGERGVITARRGSFLRLATREAVGSGVRQVGVTVVTRRGGAALVGRRSRSTRVYGGMWELGPSGGVEVDARGAGDIMASARAELREEVGIDPDPARWRTLGVVDDAVGGSFEAVVEAVIPDDLEPVAANWEYDALRWVAADGFAAFAASEVGTVIPPTLAIARALGWVGG